MEHTLSERLVLLAPCNLPGPAKTQPEATPAESLWDSALDSARRCASFPQFLLLRPVVAHRLASLCARSDFLGARTRGDRKYPWQALWPLDGSFLLHLAERAVGLPTGGEV